jgi:transposase-like protein
METRDKFLGLNSIKFTLRFHEDEPCYKYLSEIKWENGYHCKKCNHTGYCSGVKPHSRRCVKCGYDESPTSGTMFDKCKIPIQIAFHIAFRLSTKKKGMSSLELSNEFEQRQKTCWEFKWKVQQAMQSSFNYPLTGEVHVDECFIGGEEEQKKGRSKGKKKLVIVALEKLPIDGVGRAYAQIIENASSASFLPFFKAHISKDADVVTDEWTGYIPLKNDYKKLKQVPSNKGKNQPDMHIHIMNLKGWLRGIHHHCSKERLQGYLEEYHFRYNRRNNMDTIFDTLLKRMVEYEPKRLNTDI